LFQFVIGSMEEQPTGVCESHCSSCEFQ